MDIEDSGRVSIFAPTADALEKAREMVTYYDQRPELGKNYTAKVKKIMEIGAIVEVLPNVEALVHVSQLDVNRVEQPGDVARLGEDMVVKVIEINGDRIRASRKAVLLEEQGHPWNPEETARPQRDRGDRGNRGDRGDAWAVLLGQNPMAVMPQVVGTVLHDGGTRPAWQWKRSGKDYVLMAWPKDQPSRAAVLMQADEGEKFKPLSAVPFLEGLPNDLTVEDIHPWSQGGGANVAVSMIEGKNPMWFYDPLYLRDKEDLTPGVTQTFLLSGLAIALRKALLDDVNITQGPQYEAWAAQWLAENPGKTRLDVPPLKISMTGRQLIMPGRRFAEYQVRTKVERVDDVKLEKMDIKVLYVRFPFDQRPDMVLPIYASKMVLRDYDPQEGDEVDAYVWLQGRVIDMDESPAQ